MKTHSGWSTSTWMSDRGRSGNPDQRQPGSEFNTRKDLAESEFSNSGIDELAASIEKVGKAYAFCVVRVPMDESDALQETAEILSDSDTLIAIEEGLVEIERGDTVPLDDLRAELARRHRSG